MVTQSKNAEELCCLLVNDTYGELPSRILSTLLLKGQSTIQQIAQHTKLPPRRLRHGLAVLLQQNLLYYQTDHISGATAYGVNPRACYNILRSGKFAAVIGSEYGTIERDIVQNLMLLGHARISDLAKAFELRSRQVSLAADSKDGPNTNGRGVKGRKRGRVEGAEQLNEALAKLAEDDIIECVGPWSFESPESLYNRLEREGANPVPGEKATKSKAEQRSLMQKRLREARDRGRGLKRFLIKSVSPAPKKRKLTNGHVNNGESDGVPFLLSIDPNTVIRVNEDKCLVMLRNQQLAKFASDCLGETTGLVYHTLLRLLTRPLLRCRLDRRIDLEDVSNDESDLNAIAGPQLAVTTMQIFEHLDAAVNVASGIGKVSSDKIDVKTAERIRVEPPQEDMDSDEADFDEQSSKAAYIDVSSAEGEAESEADEEDDEDVVARRRGSVGRPHSAPNGRREARVKFDDGAAAQDNRLESMRQHLLLLAESRQGFVRHCGAQGRGSWTVDFGPLLKNLRRAEVDTVIERSFGRIGLRLSRMLGDKGKLDDKSLPLRALMKKSDVQATMLVMQAAGYIEVQEVPKDPTHKARNTIHLRFFHEGRAESKLLDELYKGMVRCLKTLKIQRCVERNILSFVDRKDVKGREQEVMSATHYNRYNRHLEVQRKLLGQVMRLDDLVAVLRDY